MRTSVSAMIGWLGTAVILALSVAIPWSVQHSWDQQSQVRLAKNQQERDAGIWVYGLGIDRIIALSPGVQLTVKEVLTGIELPQNASHVTISHRNKPGTLFIFDVNHRPRFETIFLAAGDQITISHTFSSLSTGLLFASLIGIVASWCWMAASLILAQFRKPSSMFGNSKWIRRAGYGLAAYSILMIGGYFFLSFSP